MARRRIKKTTDIDERASGSTVDTTDRDPKHLHPEPSLQETVFESAADAMRTHIEKLAYELYQRGGCRDGYAHEDWLEAERLALAQQTGASRNGNGSSHPSSSLM